MNDRMQEIREKVQDAELVLIGLGEDFQYDWRVLLQDKRYQEIEQEIRDSEQYVWIVPFLQKMVLLQIKTILSFHCVWMTGYTRLVLRSREL